MLSGVLADQSSVAKSGYVSVVIPVYNQGSIVSTSLERIRSVLEDAFVDYEMVVVDDGSTDDTYRVLQKEAQLHQKIKVISYKPNRGKGFAVKTGVLESKGAIVLFIDGDLDIRPDIINEYVAQLATCDLVIASKRHPASKVTAPPSRRLLSRAFNLLVRLVTGIKIKDTQAGMKAGNGEIMRKIFQTLLVKRYAFDVELLTISSLMNLRIIEMPVKMTIDRKFKFNEMVRMLVDLLSIFYRLRVIKWYQKNLAQTYRAKAVTE